MSKQAAVLILAVTLVASGYCLYFFDGYRGLSDACDYGALARNLINGDGFTLNHAYPLSLVYVPQVPQPNCIWAPGYPVFLSAMFYIFGVSDLTIIGSNLFLFFLILVAGYYLTLKYAGKNSALVFLLFMGLNQNVYIMTILSSLEMLASLFLIVSLIFWDDKYNRMVFSAVFFGLAILTRFQVIVLLPVYLVLSKKDFKKYSIFVAISLGIFSVWLIRNLVVFGEPFFFLQRFGEYTKGIGLGDDYYYTYRSLEPAGLFSVITEYPLLLLRKLIVGIPYFLSKLPLHLNSFGLFLVFWAYIFLREKHQFRIILKFLGAGLLLYIFFCLFDGHHHRHLNIFDPFLAIAASYGFIDLINRTGLIRKRAATLAVLLIFLIPLGFPQQEKWLIEIKQKVREEIPIYRQVAASVPGNGPVASDASDALWWYAQLNTVWLPTNYETLTRVDSLIDLKAIYLQKPDWLNKLDNMSKSEFYKLFPNQKNFSDGSVLFVKHSDEN